MKLKYCRVIFLFIACFLVASCVFAQTEEYRIQPMDVLTISVHDQPDMTTKVRVTNDGFISFPLLGKVKAGGQTVQNFEGALKAALEKDYLVSAQVLVFIEQYHPRKVSLVGEVMRPGKYDMPEEKEMTLLEAIALAGGFTKDASIGAVRVMRKQENGKQIVIKVNVRDITVKGRKDKDIVLQPDDSIVVPESFF
jgi:protein involved in polysaccharide export with SLBB domain